MNALGWIDFSERRPVAGEKVLLLYESGNVTFTVFAGEQTEEELAKEIRRKAKDGKRVIFADTDGDIMRYWMKLPQPADVAEMRSPYDGFSDKRMMEGEHDVRRVKYTPYRSNRPEKAG